MTIPSVESFEALKNDVENALLSLYTAGMTPQLAEVGDIKYTVSLSGDAAWLIYLEGIPAPCQPQVQLISVHLQSQGYDIDAIEIFTFDK